MPQKSREKLIKKGKNWKLTQVIVSGNYIVYYDGKEYIHSTKKSAQYQIDAIIIVSKKRKIRRKIK